jgi:hypothetical protein
VPYLQLSSVSVLHPGTVEELDFSLEDEAAIQDDDIVLFAAILDDKLPFSAPWQIPETVSSGTLGFSSPQAKKSMQETETTHKLFNFIYELQNDVFWGCITLF